MVINKTELVNMVANETGFTKKDTAVVTDSIFNVLVKAIIEGDEIALPHFGKFKTSIRKGRIGVNPQNANQKIEIPDKRVVKFFPSSSLKREVLNA